MQIRTILCPTDLSANSRVGLAYAIALARHHEAELVIYHVIPLSLAELAALCRSELAPRILTKDSALEDIFAKVRREAESRLNSHVESVFGHLLSQLRWRIRLGLGNVCQEIIDTATTEKADLIVMAKRHRSLLGRMSSASVSEQVSREASCPVLSVCPPQAGHPEDGTQWTIFPGVLQGF